MKTRRIRLVGPGALGQEVSASALRDILTLTIEGGQRALRIRVEGRSAARGTPPAWIPAATEFVARIVPGSTVLELDAPTLLEAAPEEFGQQQLFPDINPDQTALDFLAETIAIAKLGEDSNVYDRSMLRFLEAFEGIFDHGIQRIEFPATSGSKTPILFGRGDFSALKMLEKRIPPPQRVRITGRLDQIRYSDRSFQLRLASGQSIRGISEPEFVGNLRELWGKEALVEGEAHFTPAGNVLRIEVAAIRRATQEEVRTWSLTPDPLSFPRAELSYRVAQGSRSGLNAIYGAWPGDESDKQILEALAELS